MSLELSEVKKTLDISLEENQCGHEESHEESRRGRAEFHTACQYMHDTVLMVSALLAKQGIMSASIPSVGQLPASQSRSCSPANLSTTLPGIPLSTLKISDAHSAASSRTSSTMSECQGAIDFPAASAAGSLASCRASPSGPLPSASAARSCQASLSGPFPSASTAGSRAASPSAPLPELSVEHSGGSVSSHKSLPGQQVPQ
ncbi:hypothetical protein EDB84DRAFT_1570205 [Lactarius hengduanensis]|nr:hypothetical protein EDB84DRAFT_1570205 [Lactarius hengduanensis]